jgi:signal transduction histidine kinase
MKPSKRIKYSRMIFITGVALLAIMSGLFIYETYQEDFSSGIVYNTRATRLALEKLVSGLQSRESSIIRSSLIHDSIRSAAVVETDLLHQLKIIDSLAADQPLHKQDVAVLRKLFDRNIKHQNAIALRIKDPFYRQSDNFISDVRLSAVELDSLAKHINRMQVVESSLLREHTLGVQKHTIIATMMGVTVSIFSIIIFILAFYFIDQELKRSQEYLNETQTLNGKIGEINKELEEANRNLLALNSELEGKNFQLEKYARELSSFTHITSHDMQEPLRKIEFYISIVEDREAERLTDEGKKYLEKIRRSVERMRQLFLSMLDFSLTNNVDNNIEDVDLNEVLQQTFNSLKVYIKDTNTTIECTTLPTVKGIRYQLQQLFENIISNAIKFRDQNSAPEIQITHTLTDTRKQSLRGLKKDHKYHKIDFSDNGIGFEPQYAEKVFEIFQRLLPKSDSHGVGIGLAICRKIAENHGGILVAKSDLNKGAVFSLYIPANI